MRQKLLLLFFILATIENSGQPASKEDSFKRALGTYKIDDSTRLNMLLAYLQTGASNSSVYEDEAISLSRKLKLDKKLGEALVLKATNLLAGGDDSSSHSLLNQALEIFIDLDDKENQGKTERRIARVFQSRGDYYSAIDHNRKTLKLAEEIGNYDLAGNANLDIGVCYYLLSDYLLANQYYLNAKKYFEKSNNMTNVALAINNLAMISRVLKKYSTAIDYYRSAFNIHATRKDSANMAKAMQGIGIVHDLKMNSDSAIWYYDKALAVNRKINNTLNIAENLGNLAIVFNDIKQYSRAFIYFTESIRLLKDFNQTYRYHQAQVSLAELYINAPDSFFHNQHIPLGERYTIPVTLLKETIAYSRETGELNTELAASDALRIAYEKQGNFKEAYSVLSNVGALKDSILNEEKVEATTMQNARAEFDKKEAVLQATHAAELKQQQTVKYALMGGAAILLLGGTFSFLFYKRKRDAQGKQKEAELKAEISDTEMKALRSQMNPHFIFNSLNSISDYIAKNNTQLADKYLTKFAKLMRMILENSEQKEVPLANDLKALEHYMELEALRMNNKFSYEISVDDRIDKENTMVPPLLLQPFVENSIWHGIAKKEGVGKIRIFIKKEDDMVNCVVEDDGTGRKHSDAVTVSAASEKKSLGVKITSERLSVLNKIKNSNAGVVFTDLQQGTKVEVRLPLVLSF